MTLTLGGPPVAASAVGDAKGATSDAFGIPDRRAVRGSGALGARSDAFGIPDRRVTSRHGRMGA